MPLSWDLVIPPGIGILTPPTVSSWEPLQPDAATAMQSRQAASRSHLLISALIICLFTGSYISVLVRSNHIVFHMKARCTACATLSHGSKLERCAGAQVGAQAAP